MVFRRAGILVVHNRNRFLLSVPQLSRGCARLLCLELPRILLWDASCHNVDSIDHVQATYRHLVDTGARAFRRRHDRWW